MPVTERITRYVMAMYDPEDVVFALDLLSAWAKPGGSDPHERLLAAALVRADGDPDKLADALDLATTDFRDLLMYTGLEHDDWPEVLECAFGPP